MAMQSGGYDYKFVQTPADTLTCQICYCPSREPHLTTCCGHIFCKSCLEAAKKAKCVISACPVCRNEQFSSVPNLQVDRIIRNLHVYCPNNGCTWQGELNAITSHFSNNDGCQFHEVNCPNDCGTAYQRQFLTSHLKTKCPRRNINCQYCHDTGEHQFIEGQHKEECPKFPLPCPNRCEVGNIPRDGIREHINFCPLEQIQCKYHTVGCEVIMARKDQKKHNKEMMEEHLSLSVTELATTKISMEKDFRALAMSQNDAQKTIHDLTNKLATAEKEIVTLKQQLVSLTDNNDRALAEADMKFTELKSKLQPLDMMDCYWSTYLVSEATKLLSGNEVLPVVIKMSEFTKKKKQKVQWFSDPFYTHLNGYQMQLSILPDGGVYHVGSHMTVCLYIIRGPYDEQLEWPMEGVYEVKLLNQSNNSMHYSATHSISREYGGKPTEIRNPYASWYCGQFISHKALTTTNNFLKGDNLYFEISKH